MTVGPHYYVISLGRDTSTLFEAFRDTLIDIHNGGFPVASAAGRVRSFVSDATHERMYDTMRTVDSCFGGYQRQDPLKLVVVGEADMLRAFSDVTLYRDAVVGRVEGDYSATSLRDLGKIVWPVVRDAMSGVHDRAMDDLRTARQHSGLVFGIDAVSRHVGSSAGATVLVEVDYHLRGSVHETGDALTISRDVDVTDALDDVIDVVIERILAVGGHVIFVPGGSLRELERIVLIPADEESNIERRR